MSTAQHRNAKALAVAASRAARPESSPAADFSAIKRGKVLAVGTHGDRTVAELSESAETVAVHTGVFTFPPTALPAVGDFVWLVFPAADGKPIVMMSGGSTTIDFGVLVD